jgi:hypothetical protein
MDIPLSEFFRLQDGEKEIYDEKNADDDADNIRHGQSLSQARA